MISPLSNVMTFFTKASIFSSSAILITSFSRASGCTICTVWQMLPGESPEILFENIVKATGCHFPGVEITVEQAYPYV